MWVKNLLGYGLIGRLKWYEWSDAIWVSQRNLLGIDVSKPPPDGWDRGGLWSVDLG